MKPLFGIIMKQYNSSPLTKLIPQAHIDILFVNHVLNREDMTMQQLADELDVTLKYFQRVARGTLPLTYSLQRKLEGITGKTIHRFIKELEEAGYIEIYQKIWSDSLLREALFTSAKLFQKV